MSNSSSNSTTPTTIINNNSINNHQHNPSTNNNRWRESCIDEIWIVCRVDMLTLRILEWRN
ncbi:hypothetical protein E2C01_101043 [Portunus trituberculatus]|uniref:Uncharacterized protein n=1 Tax=Portunus trituberculatus TaxID=210409 RepID=A0A5B7KJ26_PORTR|nr:hypothetical protein [Portunus trituberculatus]